MYIHISMLAPPPAQDLHFQWFSCQERLYGDRESTESERAAENMRKQKEGIFCILMKLCIFIVLALKNLNGSPETLERQSLDSLCEIGCLDF